MVQEVRRQFKAKPGILKGRTSRTTPPAAISTGGREGHDRAFPLAIVSPVLVGVLFGPFTVIARWLHGHRLRAGGHDGQLRRRLGQRQKFIERGALGTRARPHKAAVVGDTVGDPFKDLRPR
jgi:K(+)-stimulated pyrophosphate-energized sodium pump